MELARLKQYLTSTLAEEIEARHFNGESRETAFQKLEEICATANIQLG